VPQKRPKRGRVRLSDGSCVRLRPAYTDDRVWAYAFVADRSHDGKPLRMLTVVDKHSRECLVIVPGRTLCSDDVIETVADLFMERLGVGTLFTQPGSPWENGYNESFSGKLRDELLNREIFYTLKEAKVLIEGRRREYNSVRPHTSLDHWPPAPEALACVVGGGLA